MNSTVSASGHDLSAAIGRAISLLQKFVVPLYAEKSSGHPVQIASAFFVDTPKGCFVVSAAHVLRELKNQVLFYYIEPQKIRKVSGRLILGRIEDGRDDDLDIAGVLLNDEASLPYRAVDKHSVPMSYLRPRMLPRTGKQYVIIGFPASRSKANPGTRTIPSVAHAYHAPTADDATYRKVGVSAETHIVLPLDLKRAYGLDGGHRNLPKPQGMSGAPIWVLFEEHESADVRVFPLVAIGTRYKRPHKALVGTDIAVAVEMMHAAV